MTLAAGTKLGPYQISALIGTGGMGAVYRARDTRLSREVALKVIQPDAVRQGRERLLQEAQAASALSHPNIVTIYDIGSEEGVDYFAMEFVAGKSLSALMERGPMPWREAVRIGIAVADAVAAAHAQGIIHRDLKPGNVMVGDDGRVRLLDFGLAKVAEPLAPGSSEDTRTLRLNTAAGTILGTLSYMSPEQAEGKPVDGRSDVFSFGAVLYEMLTGRQAFTGESGASTLSAILRDDPSPLPESTPGSLRRVVNRCLRKDRGQRFQHMADVRIALEDAAEEPSVSAQATKRARTRRWPWAAGAGLAAALAGAYFLWPKAQPEEPPYELRQLTFDDGLTFAPSISADGKLVAYSSDRAGDTGMDIWVQQTEGGSAIRLTQDPADERSPAISPDGTLVVYRSEKDGGGLYIVPSLGGESRLLARTGNEPAFSPDGRLIAFSTAQSENDVMRGRQSQLWVTTPGGDQARRLHADFASAHHPVWGADARHLYFHGLAERRENTRPGIYLSVLNDQAPVRIADARFDLSAWSPAHSRFLANQGPDANLWLVDPKPGGGWGRAPERLTLSSQRQRRPTVSTAGVVAFGEVTGTVGLWEIDLSRPGDEPRRLMRDIAPKSSPQVSPDGKYVAYVSGQTGSADVWLVDVATGRSRALTRTPALESNPVFVGDAVAFGVRPPQPGPQAIYLQAISGGPPETLCTQCGRLDAVTKDRRYVLFHGRGQQDIELFDRTTRTYSTVLRDPARALYQARISTDGRWLTFIAKTNDVESRAYAAPFKGMTPVPASEWIALTEGTAGDDKPLLTEDNSGIYFTSHADGNRCLYFQKLNRADLKPLGSPAAVHHFHSARLSLGAVPVQWLEISKAGNKLYLNLSESRGNVWLLDRAKENQPR
ncbi:MAG: protein kinase [Bryobacteraceae bacterium]|nr:protein kinase [Bryobacteraceae bacterium]